MVITDSNYVSTLDLINVHNFLGFVLSSSHVFISIDVNILTHL